MAPRNRSVWTQTDMQTLTDRMSGRSRASTTNARRFSQGSGQRLGRGSYVVYNVQDYENLSPARRNAIGEMLLGRQMTRSEQRNFRISRMESMDSRERTRPVDRATGERLNIYRNMTAFKVTFS